MSDTVARMSWIKPHAFFKDVISNENGAEEPWTHELGSPNTAMRYGCYRDTLQASDLVTVDGYLASSDANLANAKMLL